MPANVKNSSVAKGLENVRFHSNPKERQCQKCSNYHTIALISHASKVILKILQARLQQYLNCELPDVQAGFRKGRGTRDQIANIHWIIEKGREFQKYIYFCFIDYAKALDCVDHNKLWKILKELGIFIVSVYKYKEFLCINFMSGDFNSLIKTNDFLVAPLEVSV